MAKRTYFLEDEDASLLEEILEDYIRQSRVHDPDISALLVYLRRRGEGGPSSPNGIAEEMELCEGAFEGMDYAKSLAAIRRLVSSAMICLDSAKNEIEETYGIGGRDAGDTISERGLTEVSSALWRLVDAAGLTADFIEGWDWAPSGIEPTGRGFRIAKD